MYLFIVSSYLRIMRQLKLENYFCKARKKERNISIFLSFYSSEFVLGMASSRKEIYFISIKQGCGVRLKRNLTMTLTSTQKIFFTLNPVPSPFLQFWVTTCILKNPTSVEESESELFLLIPTPTVWPKVNNSSTATLQLWY